MAHSQAINNNFSSSMPHIQRNTLLEIFSNIFSRTILWSLDRFGKSTRISMISNSVTHLRSYTNSAITDIAGNSAPISPVTPRDCRRRRADRRRLRIERRRPRIERRRPRIERRRPSIERRYLRIEWWVFQCFIMFHNVLWVFHDVLLVVHDVLRCITMFYMCFMLFYCV